MNGSYIDSECNINSYTYIGYDCFVTKTDIGRYCSIANNVTIGPGEHILEDISTSAIFYDSPYSQLTQKDCVIQNDVWIGVNAVVRRGVEIGNGVIIGANSFVNRDIPDFAIAVGSPAKIIKYRFDKKKQKYLLSSQWWNLELEDAQKFLKQAAKKWT